MASFALLEGGCGKCSGVKRQRPIGEFSKTTDVRRMTGVLGGPRVVNPLALACRSFPVAILLACEIVGSAGCTLAGTYSMG
jgi:hypothetical protein